MAIGVIANSKGALVFAGGVLVSAALVAMSMGSQFTPKPQDEDYAEEEVDSSEEASERAPAHKPEPVVFGDFGDDADLIDDTGGFDPAPPAEPTIIIPTNVDDDGNWGSAESSVVSAAPVQTTARSRARQRQTELDKYTPTNPTSAGSNSRPDVERGEEEG